VAGFDGTVGDYPLTVGCEPGAAVNDACADAILIEEGSTPFDTTGAGTDGPAHAACLSFGDNQVNQDIWYRFVADCDGELTVSTCGTADFDTRLAAYEGTECPVTDERLLGCNDDGPVCPDFTSLLVVQVEAGQSYLIRVGGFGVSEGAGMLSVTCEIPGGPPNNTCSNALPIEEGSTPFDTTAATTNGLEPGCAAFIEGDGQIHKDVWFTYTATCTGELFVDTCGTAAFDTRLAVYQGAGCPLFPFDLLACNDDGADCPDGTSALVVTVVEGQQYTVRVGGFGPQDGGPGSLQVSFSPVLQLTVDTEPDGFQPGETVLVHVQMANLCGAEAAGFQAFVEFDEGTLEFVAGTYTPQPFGLPVIFPITATAGQIDMAAGVDKSAGQMPTSVDAVLATLEFTSLISQCEPVVQFREGDPPSRLTDAAGNPIEPLQLLDQVACSGDVNRDGTVDVDDLVAVILAWGTIDCSADANDDGSVNVDDLIAVIIAWGPCPEL
jgi:hypothetical protein